MQKVYDVAGLFNVLDMQEDLFLLLLIHITDNLHSVVSVHVVDEAFGDGLRGELFQKLVTDILIHLGEGVGGLLVVKLPI